MNLKNEEELFLSLCCSRDYNLLTGKQVLMYEDFERITYLTQALNLPLYTTYLYKTYLDFSTKMSDKLDRECGIYNEYPSYYEDEGIIEKEKNWVNNFVINLPENKRDYCLELLKKNISYY